ncbi:MAG: potassium-transporting ATPase subunit KdpC [Acidobacteria bacterium]|nr:potassium-transporting ATPase subunit KdpC [Acidobacteriota bacterium]MCW5949270.1 potassium-transporting ATPase subunit KdpC [Pyrinomonadaceae bacterium]
MKLLYTSTLMLLAMTILLGGVYPLAVWGVGQLLFPSEANGSLIYRDGKVAGSRLIGQRSSSPGYFYSRPSAAGDGYDAAASAGSNLGPTNRVLIERVAAEADRLSFDGPQRPVPADLVTTSGSGLDPHISPAAAEFQVPRVAKERGIAEGRVRELVAKYTSGRELGIFGEPRVNVLGLNIELDETAKNVR